MNSWFLERSANFYSVLSRENSTVAIKIFYAVSFEAVARGLDDISNKPLKCVDVSGDFCSIPTSKHNYLWKFTYPGPELFPVSSLNNKEK